MSTIVTRSGKGSPLTHAEVDANFTNLNTDKYQEGSAIGAVTPAAGTFTTLTAQTEVLKGTGQNLVPQSQTFTSWTKAGATVTNNVTTAPDGTSTASSLVEDSSTGSHQTFYNNITLTTTTYTFSVYAKANTRNWIKVSLDNGALKGVYFDVTNGVVGTADSGYTGTIVSAGSGWYRCSIVFTAASSGSYFPDVNLASSNGTVSYTGNGTNGLYIWGAQVEVGSTLNTYIPTTTAAVYGTPTLSFSGVAGIGLQSDGSLYHQPAGTGAVQAQATTSTATGGNARGANAVDWQTFTRSSAAQVASGLASSVLGGARNTSNSVASTVVCGTDNTAGANNAFVGSGSSNTANGTSNAIVSGLNNAASGTFAFIGAGQANTTAGFLNVIGGGQTNSGTSGSAVTTQSATMNGTTAVTLSGSNANIKVGQLITGTSIVSASGTTPYTYVAAISGTSLTLSQAASGSSTSTLSFYTPHGVVVGGGNNQATGSYSFIGGGGDAGTAANRNVASGDWSTVAGGMKNTASGVYSSVVGGGGNTASGQYATVAGGGIYGANTASGNGSFVAGGWANQATQQGSITITGNNGFSNSQNGAVIGGSYGTSRGLAGNTVFSANVAISSNGIAQSALLVLYRQTTDATATVLTSDTNAASTTNQVILPNNSAYYFKGTVVAGVTGGGNTKGWTIEGVIKRGANAASTTVVGVTVASMYADAGAVTWTIAAAADTTNGGLAITFTGQAGTTIRTVCSITTTEMTF